MISKIHKRGIIYMLLILTLNLSSLAQKRDYLWGYIVSHKGDTTSGWVKDRSTGPFGTLYQKIRFKGEGKIFKKKYSPRQILAYGYSNQRFVSMPLREETSFFKFRYILDAFHEPVFLRVVREDPNLTYYQWEYVDDDNNYIDSIPLFHKPEQSEMVRVTQGILGLKRNRLTEYFYDCDELIEALENKSLKTADQVYDFYLSYINGTH